LAFASFLVWRLRTGAALAALALVVFGAIACPSKKFSTLLLQSYLKGRKVFHIFKEQIMADGVTV